MVVTPNTKVLDFSFLNLTKEELRISARNPSTRLQEGRRIILGLDNILGHLLPGELFVFPLPPQFGEVYKKIDVDPFYSPTSYFLREIRKWPHNEYEVVKR